MFSLSVVHIIALSVLNSKLIPPKNYTKFFCLNGQKYVLKAVHTNKRNSVRGLIHHFSAGVFSIHNA